MKPCGFAAACIFALVLAACLGPVGSVNSVLCAKMVVASIQHLVALSYDLNEAVVDCTLPGLSESSCAADIVDMMSYWFNLGARITSTLVCGSIDDACAANILQALGDTSDTSSVLIAAANDCQTDPWLCTYDVVAAVDVVNAFVEDIMFAMHTCNNPNLNPKFLTYWAWNGESSRGRRLSTASAGATATTLGRAERTRQLGNSTGVDELYEELQAELDALTAVAAKAKRKREQSGPVPNSTTTEDKRAAFERLRETVRQQRAAQQESSSSLASPVLAGPGGSGPHLQKPSETVFV